MKKIELEFTVKLSVELKELPFFTDAALLLASKKIPENWKASFNGIPEAEREAIVKYLKENNKGHFAKLIEYFNKLEIAVTNIKPIITDAPDKL